MFDAPADLYLSTVNAGVDFRRGALTAAMSAGAALDMAERWPGCAEYFAGAILDYEVQNHHRAFGVLLHPILPIGIFQVKYQWWQKADLWLIEQSSLELQALCNDSLQGKNISLNFPGIGYGGRKRSEVLPLITALPDNISVWEKD
jgi:hypothetical protein